LKRWIWSVTLARMAVNSCGKAAVIQSGGTRATAKPPVFLAIARLTISPPAKFAGTWAFQTFKNRAAAYSKARLIKPRRNSVSCEQPNQIDDEDELKKPQARA